MRPTSETVARGAAEALCDEDEILAEVARGAQQPAARASGTDTFTRLPPIYFIGDSRTVQFRNAIYTSEFTARAYLLRSVYLRTLHAADFCSREGAINDTLLNALATDQAVTTRDEGVRWTATPADGATPNGPAPLVLFCGMYDAFRMIDELGLDADIPAWDELSRYCEVSSAPAARLVSAGDVLRRAVEVMEPFALGIEALRAMGFDRIFVHGAPRFKTGERFDRLHGQAKWRRQVHPNAVSKVLILFDEAVRSVATRTSARYVPGPADARGMLPSELTWDDVHYNAEGARELVRSVVSVLEGVVE